MTDNKNEELLFQYACGYRFNEFDSLFCEMEEEMSPDALGEAYLMRAQIKLCTTDLTAPDDLAKAMKGSRIPKFPPLINSWKSDGINHFIAFSKASGLLKEFVAAFPEVRKKLSYWYGNQSDIVLTQMQGEICYFMGDIEMALPFAETHRSMPVNRIDAILGLILEYRCYLALMQPEKAQQCMFDIIRHSKAYPECVEIYGAFRLWANLTTGWSGDSPRFYEDEDGREQPVLKDRLEGIRLGLARHTPIESHFIEYAEKSCEDIYTIRQYYMDWFHAMYWLSVDDRKQAETYFHKIYKIAAASGVFMPVIECGAQSLPILEYMKKLDTELPLDDVMRRSKHYEECVNVYRLADN